MMFKRFFGKTVEAAKNSARQMYGDNFTIFESHENEEENAGITIAVDKKQQYDTFPVQKFSHTASKKINNGTEGVRFERSNHPENVQHRESSRELHALRKFAEEHKEEGQKITTDSTIKNQNGTARKRHFTPTDHSNSGRNNDLYNRRDIFRNSKPVIPGNTSSKKESFIPEKKIITAGEPKNSANSVLSLFDQSRPKIKNIKPEFDEKSRENRYAAREIKSLHKRFDRLESLLDSNILATNIDYILHPVFQQLLQTGIQVHTVSRWFSNIIKEGIDPWDQSALFMTKLSKLLKDVLSIDSTEEPKKFQLFTGASGSGKTELIMKLALHPDFMKNKEIAVICLLPDSSEKQNHYYSKLKPFCRDLNISYFEITGETELAEIADQLEDFDFVLIDTPSLNLENEDSFKNYWETMQLFSEFEPIEVHFVVNISMKRHYFKNKSALHHPLRPDYIALTHLDANSQWGEMIPIFEEMDSHARYVSNGNFVPESLSRFSPGEFAKQLLQDN